MTRVLKTKVGVAETVRQDRELVAVLVYSGKLMLIFSIYKEREEKHPQIYMQSRCQ